MDQYSSLHIIGKGSYGEVFLVKNLTDSKQYVLKRVKLYSLSEKEKRAATQESRLLSQLSHPNIVSYKDSFHSNGLLHIIMNYCEGGDLNRYLKARNSCYLSESKIIHWFIQISLALQYLHRQNILHRDLKTQNVFLSRNIIKLGDLGIARVLDSSSAMARTFIGTPYYMSPEIFRKIPYNHKSDIWALGCCVVEMATLKTAFSARDINALALKIIMGKYPSIPTNYSTQLKQMIKCLLARDPDQRPSVDQILKLSFIRNHIRSFLYERRKGRSEEYKPKNDIITPKIPPIPIQEEIIDETPTLTDVSNETQNSQCTISTLTETSGENNNENTLTIVSSCTEASTMDVRRTSPELCPNKEILNLSANSGLNDSQPERLLKNISITQVQESEKQLEGNDIIEPNQKVEESELKDSDSKDSVEQESPKTITPPYSPQLVNLSEFNSPPPSVNGVSAEAADSEARQRRREQKRQQNYSNTLINRYIRKSSDSDSPVKQPENPPSIQTVVDNNTTEENTEGNPTDSEQSETMDADTKPCLKLCTEMRDSIDSDEEKMLTLLSSTLTVTDEVPLPPVSTLPEEWISRARSSSFEEILPHITLSECGEFSKEDMLSNISIIEDECKQGLGERLFLTTQYMLDKYHDDLEDLELNLKLILGEEKYPIYVTLLLRLKFYRQLCSTNFTP